MNAAYREAFGRDLAIIGSYRTLAEQVSTRGGQGGLAAVPGTSNHGWGLAIDLGDGANSYRSRAVRLAQGQRVLFGWHHPTYMDEGGRGPHEPWHWEFGTSDDAGTGTSVPITVGVQAPTTPPQSRAAPAPRRRAAQRRSGRAGAGPSAPPTRRRRPAAARPRPQ